MPITDQRDVFPDEWGNKDRRRPSGRRHESQDQVVNPKSRNRECPTVPDMPYEAEDEIDPRDPVDGDSTVLYELPQPLEPSIRVLPSAISMINVVDGTRKKTKKQSKMLEWAQDGREPKVRGRAPKAIPANLESAYNLRKN